MKDEVEKLENYIEKVLDQYKNHSIDPEEAVSLIIGRLDKAQVEAVRAAAQEIHDSGMGGAKDDSERFWRMVESATNIIDEAEDQLTKEDGSKK